MYKLIIVDDEREIREGLASIPWDAMGIESTGLFAHGLDALQYISEHPVDIVLTDIRMPFMDGLELMDHLHRNYPYIKVVVLSGYNDFEYAKKALQSGAADYLLKPTVFSALTETFDRLVNMLNVNKQEEYRKSVLERKEVLLSKLLREEFLQRLFQFPLSPDEIEQGCSEGELLLEGQEFTVAVIQLDRVREKDQVLSAKELGLITFSLENILQDLWDNYGYGYHLVDKKNATCYLLLKQQLSVEPFSHMKEQLMRFRGLFKSTISVCVGPSVTQLDKLWQSAHSALIRLSNVAQNDQFVVIKEQDMDVEWPAEPVAIPVNELVGERQGQKKESLILTQAKQFIHENFNRSITLKETANQLYITPGHLSALFRESGETFLQCLTKYRMNKAMELLSDARYKVYEIVELVGYSDASYFTEVFKKHTGQTPLEFRGISK